MLRVTAIQGKSAESGRSPTPPIGTAVLSHDERHLRRRVLTLANGYKIFLNLPETVVLASGDTLVLEGGATVAIEAAEEDLYEVLPRNANHLVELAWHIGNRHLAAAILPDRILLLRDHVIKHMLEGLGAEVVEIVAPFNPLRGAYDNDSHGSQRQGFHVHGNEPHHSHSQDHDHGQLHHHEGPEVQSKEKDQA